MALLETLGGLAIKVSLDLSKYIVANIFKKENDELINKVTKALDAAITRFFDKYGDRFGEPSSCFLERITNWDIIVGACFYGQQNLKWEDIDPHGFDEAPNADREAVEFFVRCLKEEMSKSWDLDKILREKKFYEKVEDDLNTISHTQIELKSSMQGIVDEVKSSKKDNLNQFNELAKMVTQISQLMPSAVDISTNLMTTEYQAELKYAEGLIDKNNPSEALVFLNQLRDRIWDQAKPEVKFKLLTNIAAAHLAFANYDLAGPLLIEAMQYQPNEEKAIRNAGYGYLVMNMPDKAIQKANEVLALNPVNCSAYSILIQAASINSDFTTLLATIPDTLQCKTEIAYALGVLSRKQGNGNEAEKWFNIAIDNDKEKNPDVFASLGTVILDSMVKDHGVVIGKQLDNTKKQRIERGVKLLSEAWEKVYNTQLKNAKVVWLYNRSLGYRMLGNISDAANDLELAASLDPSNTEYKKQLAILELLKRDWPKAISILETILLDSNYPELPIILAQALANNGEFPKAISILNEYLTNEEMTSGDIYEARRILLNIYLDMGEMDSAKNTLEAMKQNSEETEIRVIIDSAIFEKKMTDKKDSAISILIKAVVLINDTTPYCDIQMLADELYALEEYNGASQVYAKITNINCDSLVLRRYVIALFKAGNSATALKICKNVKYEPGQEKFYIETEAFILQEIGNLPDARAAYEKYLKNNPDDLEIKLRLATINLKARNFDLVDDFLNSEIEILALPTDLAVLLSQLYSAREMDRKALELAYELRRSFGTGEMHAHYLYMFFSCSDRNEEWLDATEVAVNTAVAIESDNGRTENYLIEDRQDVILSRGEINIANVMTQRLLGKKIGDTVLLKDSPISKKHGKIIAIKSKFVHAFHESLDLTESDLIDIPGFLSVPIGKPQKAGELPEGLETIIKTNSSGKKTLINHAEDLYKKGAISVGAFARLIGKNVIDVWGAIVKREDIGLKASLSNSQIIINQPNVVIDVISLLTIHGLNVQDEVAKCFGVIGIGQSTVDLLSDKLVELNSFGARGFLTLGQNENGYVKEEVSADNVAKTNEHLESILAWLDKYCKIHPCNAALNMDRQKKLKWDDSIGKSFIDSILIAEETNSLLFSDDLILRRIAQSFKVEGLSIQQVLDTCLSQGHIERSAYNETIMRLILSNYQYPAINAEILLHSIKSEGNVNINQFNKVSRLLGGNFCESNSAIRVSVQFLYELYKQADLTLINDAIVQTLIANLVNNRDSKIVLKKLVSLLQSKFLLLPFAEKRIIETIELWRKSHLSDF